VVQAQLEWATQAAMSVLVLVLETKQVQVVAVQVQ
jgi:hypothetical protein